MDFNIFFGFQQSGSQCYKSCLLGSILSWEGEIALNLQKKVPPQAHLRCAMQFAILFLPLGLCDYSNYCIHLCCF